MHNRMVFPALCSMFSLARLSPISYRRRTMKSKFSKVTFIASTLCILTTGSAFAENPTLTNIVRVIEPKVIFVTSQTYTGNLGGLAGADAICQALADGVNAIVPEGEYVALLSTSDFEVINAAGRLTPTSGPIVRPDGVPVAENFARLFGTQSVSDPATNLITVPNIDETGTPAPGASLVWTGTGRNGSANGGHHCNDWNLASGITVIVGQLNQLDGGWLDIGAGSADPCDSPKRFYCVQY